MEKDQIKSKTYVLLRMERPVSFILQSKSNKRKPLLSFDAEKNYNRPLRYAVNQRSPFEDEQDGSALLEPIIFEDGMLYVNKENQVLQKFLALHPENGRTFEERDPEKDAIKAIAIMEKEESAILAVKDLNLDQLKTLIRVGTQEDVNKLTTSEIKHNARVLARNHPEEVLRILNDPLLKVQDIVARAFEDKILTQKTKDRAIYLNNKGRSSRIMNIPPGENKIFITAKFLQSNEGLEVLKIINDQLEIGEE